MTTPAEKVDERKDRKRALQISTTALCVTILIAIGQGVRDFLNARSADRKFGNIETSLRILTQTVAPQIYQSVDDSLRSAVSLDDESAAKALDRSSAAIRQLQDSKTKPDVQRLSQSASILADVAVSHPNVAASWSTSAQLISFRSDSLYPQKNLGFCVERPWSESDEAPAAVPNAVLQSIGIYHDCTLIVDDVGAFLQSEAYVRYLQNKQNFAKGQFILGLNRVHVIYRGGKLIPVDGITFRDCTFEFQSVANPPDSGRKLLLGLLKADIDKPTTIEIANGI